MTNKLTQAELIDLAKEAGFKETRWSDILGVKVESLAKFAQLIQERQGEALAIGEVRDNGVVWFGPNPHDEIAHPLGTKFYTSPVDASQLVAQALEKSADIVENNTHDGLNGKNTAALIRALIDQPVDHIEESLGMVEPTSQESRQVEQGWDELRKVYFFTVIKGSEWDPNVLSDGTFRGCGIEQGFQTFKAAYSPEVIQALGVVLCDAEPVAEVVDSKLADFMPSHQKVEWHKTDFAVGTKFHAIKEQS